MDFADDFSWIGSRRQAAGALADHIVRVLQTHQRQALLLCFRLQFRVPCEVREEVKPTLRALQACRQFARPFERHNPAAAVRLVMGLSHYLRDSEAGVRMGALSFLKTLAEQTEKLHRLMAKIILDALHAGGSATDRERATRVLGTCKRLGRFGRPAVAALLAAARMQETVAASCLASVLRREPARKHPHAARFMEAIGEAPEAPSKACLWIEWAEVAPALKSRCLSKRPRSIPQPRKSKTHFNLRHI